MDEESFLSALQKIGGIANKRAARLFSELYKSEQKVKLLEFQLSEENIHSIEDEIYNLKECIRETEQNNKIHQRRIVSCSHLLGLILVRPQVSEHYRMQRLIEKTKKKYELLNKTVEEYRIKLNEPQKKPKLQQFTGDMTYYQKVVDDYLAAETDLYNINKLFESYEESIESLGFSLVEEINEYQNCAKSLNIDIDDFNPTKAIAGILEFNDDTDNESYATITE